MIEQRELDSPKTAHAAATELYKIAKRRTKACPARHVMQLISVDEERRHQLRKLFHGPVLRDISEQVWVPDPKTGLRVRYAQGTWKLLFAEMFIAPKFEKYRVARTGQMKVRERRRSTEDLNDDQFTEFLLQVQAFAACELGVEFVEQGAQ